MEKLNFSIKINAPVESVWNTMLDDKTYRAWTAEFHEGSYYIGDWSVGSKMLFVALTETGGISGMVSRIEANRKYEFISIEHLGFIENGKEDTTSEVVKAWQGAHENYTFKQVDGATEVIVDIDVNDEFKEMFKDMWPRALVKLKSVAETTIKNQLITVSVVVHASIEKVWDMFTKPEHITKWAFASDDWESPFAENDLRVGGKFVTTMSAKDGSSKFNFNGIYSSVKQYEYFEYNIEGGRYVKVSFEKVSDGVKVTEDFEPETENSPELQQSGWQAILENFRKYVEMNKN